MKASLWTGMAVSALLMSGCSQDHGERKSSSESLSVKEISEGPAPEAPPPPPMAPIAQVSRDASGAPNIGPTSAPGVAFNYRYAFRLANNRIGAVQEQHAQACEKLGVTRCRITGMRYALVDGDDVEAYLSFKLDPALARQFGKDGIAAVTKAEGMLVDSVISGIDEGSNIKQSVVRSAEVRDRLAEIEKQLRDDGLKSAERAQLQMQADALRQQFQGEAQSRTNSEQALASIPVAFHYGTGNSIPGFDGASPLKDSWRAAVSSFMTMLGFVMLAVGVLLPWLLLVGILWALWRSAPLRALCERVKAKPVHAAAVEETKA